MKLKVITQEGKLSHLEVEEKPKSYKIISQNDTGICRAFINKSWINTPYIEYGYNMFLAYDCSDEEAIKMWNEKLHAMAKRLDERYIHHKAQIESRIIK